MHGVKRYPLTLRMLSREVDDVMVRGYKPLDVLAYRVPHCSMPSPEAQQVQSAFATICLAMVIPHGDVLDVAVMRGSGASVASSVRLLPHLSHHSKRNIRSIVCVAERKLTSPQNKHIEKGVMDLILVGLRTQTQNAAFFERKGPKCKPWPRGKSLNRKK